MLDESMQSAFADFLESDFGKAANRHAETLARLVKSARREQDCVHQLAFAMVANAYYRGYGDGLTRAK